MRGFKKLLQRFSSPELTRPITGTPDRMFESSRRLVTVLFCNICGFTSICEKLELEQTAEVLTEYLTEMTDIVFKHGGIIDQYIGDRLMALYNVPFDDHEHAIKAVRTGLELREHTLAMSAHWEAKLGAPLHTTVGINTGEAVVGVIGSPQRLLCTAIGDPVDLAAYLVQAAEPDSILIGETTNRMVQSVVRVERLDALRVHGRGSPIVAYRLISMRPGPTTPEKTD